MNRPALVGSVLVIGAMWFALVVDARLDEVPHDVALAEAEQPVLPARQTAASPSRPAPGRSHRPAQPVAQPAAAAEPAPFQEGHEPDALPQDTRQASRDWMAQVFGNDDRPRPTLREMEARFDSDVRDPAEAVRSESALLSLFNRTDKVALRDATCKESICRLHFDRIDPGMRKLLQSSGENHMFDEEGGVVGFIERQTEPVSPEDTEPFNPDVEQAQNGFVEDGDAPEDPDSAPEHEDRPEEAKSDDGDPNSPHLPG